MLVITNNCMGGYFYRDEMKIQYNHPFFWGTMHDDILKLILNWDKINFKKYVITKDEKSKYILIIDDIIKYKLIHYHFSSRDITIRKNDHDVFYNKIEEYIKEKYETRINRMLNSNEKPIFIIHWLKSDGFTEEKLEDFIKKDIKYKTIIFMPYEKYKNYINKNIKLIYEPLSSTGSTKELSKKIFNNL